MNSFYRLAIILLGTLAPIASFADEPFLSCGSDPESFSVHHNVLKNTFELKRESAFRIQIMNLPPDEVDITSISENGVCRLSIDERRGDSTVLNYPLAKSGQPLPRVQSFSPKTRGIRAGGCKFSMSDPAIRLVQTCALNHVSPKPKYTNVVHGMQFTDYLGITTPRSRGNVQR